MRKCVPLLLAILCSFAELSYSDDSAYVELLQVSGKTWVHKSYATMNGYRVDSNGMVIDCSTGILMVDTCWNDEQTQSLIDKIAIQFKKPILLAIITHAHDDRIGGIRSLLKSGIKVVSTPLTRKRAILAGYAPPLAELDENENVLQLGECTVETYYPGAGHTEDNITVWIPSEGVLFGGCLIKSIEARNLGNLADAIVAEWASSVRRLLARYPNARIVIPGHGRWGSIELLKHTIELCPQE